MTAPSDVIRKHIEAFNARDQRADPWSAGAEMVTPAGTMTGRDQVLGFLGVFQEAFPDGRLEIKQLLADGPAASLDGALRATHNGGIHSPGADTAPPGTS